jgi:hypothetical protein
MSNDKTKKAKRKEDGLLIVLHFDNVIAATIKRRFEKRIFNI